jgi:hypothetical protein
LRWKESSGVDAFDVSLSFAVRTWERTGLEAGAVEDIWGSGEGKAQRELGERVLKMGA